VSIFLKRGAERAALRSNPVTITCEPVPQEKHNHCDEVKGDCVFFVVLLLVVSLQAVGPGAKTIKDVATWQINCPEDFHHKKITKLILLWTHLCMYKLGTILWKSFMTLAQTNNWAEFSLGICQQVYGI
jgi:hypothetical protein